MREILLDYARHHHAAKRGGQDVQNVEIDAVVLGVSSKIENVIAIDEALQRLARIDPRQSRLIELRFFAGLNVDEAAEVMGGCLPQDDQPRVAIGQSLAAPRTGH